MLFIVNDRPEVAVAVDADGIHVGQDDMAVAKVREIVGHDVLVGLSTHSSRRSPRWTIHWWTTSGVGPIYATPTKPGRPAVGLELVRHAATHSPVPFFAIGQLSASNIADALDAGAARVCVLRAIANAAGPTRATRTLRALLA